MISQQQVEIETTINDSRDTDITIYDRPGGGGGGGSSVSNNNGNISESTNNNSDNILDDLILDTTEEESLTNLNKNDGVEFESGSGPIVVNTSVVNYYVDDEFDVYLIGILNYTDNLDDIQTLAKMFSMSKSNMTLICNEFKNSSTILNGKGYWINTIRFSEFIKNIGNFKLERIQTPLENTISGDEDELSYNDWLLTSTTTTSTGTSITFRCQLRFLRPYIYNPVKLTNGITVTPSKWNNVSITFNIIGETSKYSISYTNINGFLWFKLSSYFKVRSILIKGLDTTNETAQIPIYIDEDLYTDSENKPTYIEKFNATLLHSFLEKPYIYTYNSNSVDSVVMNLNATLYNSVNSEKYFSITNTDESDEIFGTKIYEFKVFLGDAINEWHKKEGNLLKTYEIEIFADLLETFTVDSDDPVFRAYSNTNTSVMWVNKQYVLHDTYPKSRSETSTTTTPDTTTDTNKTSTNCVAIFQRNQGESSFGGTISMFYGNQYIYPENIVTILNNNGSAEKVNVKGNGDKYTSDNPSLYYYTEVKDDKLYIYVKTTDDKNVALHRFVSIYLSDNSKSQYSSGIGNTTLSSKISQDNVIVHSVDISTPQVTADDELVWIDNSFNNKTKHYTHYTLLETTPGSYAYYGVRAYAKRTDNYFNNNIYSIGINGLSYNVPATIVKLNPYKEQQNIYSFKDGDEMVLLNTTNTGARLEDDADTWTGYEILSSYAHSYEYIVDKIHYTDSSYDYNFRFYAGKAFAYFSESSAYSSYYSYIRIPYTKTETLSNPTYTKVSSLNRMRPSNELSYTPEFIAWGDGETKDIDNLYSQVTEYVKVTANSVSFDYFKEIIEKDDDTSSDPFGTGLFYKYSTITNNYVRYIVQDLENINSTPLNLYVKQVYYVKVKQTSNDKDTYYKKNFSYKQYTENKSLQNLISNNCYQKIGSEYIPVTGFIRDGSAPYYGYKLVPLSQANLNNIVNNGHPEVGGISNLNESVFIRSYYKNLFENTEKPNDTQEIQNIIKKFKVNNIPIYKLESLINYKSITKSDATIYDIDITGNTIYAYSESIDGIFNIDTVRNVLQHVDWTDSATDKDNIIRNENSSYRLTNFNIDGNKISYTVSFDGAFIEVEYSTAEELLIENKVSLYALDDEYHYNQYEGITTDSINKLSKYKIDDYIFIKIFSKLETEYLNDYNRRAFIIPPGEDGIKNRQNKGEIYYKLPNGNYKGLMYFVDNKGYAQYTGILNSSESITPIDINNINGTFYTLEENYVNSADIYYSVNNEYYSLQKTKTTMSYIYRAKGDEEIAGTFSYTTTFIPELDEKSTVNDKTVVKHKDGYNYNPEDIKYYASNISYYFYDDNVKTKIIDVPGNKNFYKTILTDVPTDTGKTDYTYNIYFKTKYFYPEFTYNDGIHVDVSGSYYTNLYVYDGQTGSRIRKMFLNNYKYDISHYSFDLTTRSKLEVNANSLPSNVSIYDYKDYYIRYEDKYGNIVDEHLNEHSESPSYYLSTGNYAVFTYVTTTDTQEYNAIGKYQLSYGDDSQREPIVIEMNNDLYGLIFDINIESPCKSPFITFDNYYDQLSNDKFVIINDNDKKIFYDFQLDENDIDSENATEYSNALDAMSDELYYNDYTGKDVSTVVYGVAYFTPQNYLYEIVPLSRFTFRHYDGDRSIVQAKSVTTENIISTIPFSISNAEEISFPGTYTWIPPKYNEVVNPDGASKVIIEKDGYWRKDYTIEKKPFNISSYNYYPKDQVNMVNISYNYMPYSYIVTAEINHPSISYETLTNEIREEIRYSYLLNGFEFDYPSSDPLINKNGTYYGVTYLYDMDGTYINMQVPLYKRNDISATSVIKSYELQPEHISYSYFAYIQATPLTNEKIPVLYNTELMPASTRKVQYWDSFRNSYAIKTVIDSYAYYSYKYIYETVPFQVASYIFTEDLGISNFPVLGAYIDNITKTLGDSLGKQSEAVGGLTESTSELLKQKIQQDEKWYDVNNTSFKSYTSNLTGTINSFDTNTNTSLANLSTSLTDRITLLTAKEEASLNSLSENTVKVITAQHNVIKDGLTHNADTINERFTSFENKYHEDIIGGAALENISTTYERVTFKPIINGPSGLVSGYSYIKETGEQTVKTGGSSLGEILKNSLGSMMDYTKTDVHDDGSYTVTTYKGFMGIANILANLSINKKLPDYNEFMVDLTPKLFSAVDFEGDYDIEYDINGQIKSKKKRNPTDIAKKCIMRADILWNELKKKGIVS